MIYFKTENLRGSQDLLYNLSFKAWILILAGENQIMDTSLSSYIKVGIQIEQKYLRGLFVRGDLQVKLHKRGNFLNIPIASKALLLQVINHWGHRRLICTIFVVHRTRQSARLSEFSIVKLQI